MRLVEKLAALSARQLAKHGPHYTAFAIFGIIINLFPYFIWPAAKGQLEPFIVYMRFFAGWISFGLLMWELWPNNLKKYLPLYYYFVLLCRMPVLGSFWFIASGGSTICGINLLLTWLVVLVLTDWKTMLLLGALAIPFSSMLLFSCPANVIPPTSAFSYSAVFFNLVSAACLLLWCRRKDLANVFTLQALNGSMAHSFHTPLMVFTIRIDQLKTSIPSLINNYGLAQSHGLAAASIPNSALESIGRAPLDLECNVNKLKANIEIILGRMRANNCKAKATSSSHSHGYFGSIHLPLKPLQWIDQLAAAARNRAEIYGEHYTIFAIFCVVINFFPFILWSPPKGELEPFIIYLRIIAAVFCFLLLVNSFWPAKLRKYLALFWYAAMLYRMPIFGAFWLILTKGSWMGWLNLFLTWLVVLVLTDWKIMALLGALSFPIAAFMVMLTPTVSGPIINPFSYSSVFLNLVSATALLLWCRRKDIANAIALRTMGATIASSFHVPLNVFSARADELRNHLPALLDAHKLAVAQGLEVVSIYPAAVESLSGVADDLTSNTRRLQDNIENILAKMWSKPIEQPTQTICARQCLDSVMAEYPFTPEQREKVSTNYVSQDFLLKAFPGPLMLAFNEVLKNAFIAIAKAGKGYITISASAANRTICFEDSALGVPEQLLSRIFDAKFTTDQEHGNGLGLYYCELVMADIGGTISCESKEQEFTRFIFTFPTMS